MRLQHTRTVNSFNFELKPEHTLYTLSISKLNRKCILVKNSPNLMSFMFLPTVNSWNKFPFKDFLRWIG